MSETELVPTDSAQLVRLVSPGGGFSGEELDLMATLISQDDRADIAIPETIDDSALWQALGVCSKVHRRVGRVQAIVKVLIGRALILMQSRPAMIQESGCKTLDDFITSEGPNGLKARTGISRNEGYACKRVAENLPMVTMPEVREIGFSKLKEITRVVGKNDSTAPEWIEKAKTLSLEGLRDAMYRSDNNIPPGSLEYDTLTVTLNKEEKGRLQEFLKTPEYQAYCGTAQPAAMLLRAIEEATGEWDLQIREEESKSR